MGYIDNWEPAGGEIFLHIAANCLLWDQWRGQKTQGGMPCTPPPQKTLSLARLQAPPLTGILLQAAAVMPRLRRDCWHPVSLPLGLEQQPLSFSAVVGQMLAFCSISPRPVVTAGFHCFLARNSYSLKLWLAVVTAELHILCTCTKKAILLWGNLNPLLQKIIIISYF